MNIQPMQSKPEIIAATLEQEILKGKISDGDALASESALVKRFSVSRTTVRKSLGILAEKGLIRTRVGIGSFVTFGDKLLDSPAGWSVALADRGMRIGTRVIRIARILPDLEMPDIAEGQFVLAVDRVRFRQDDGTGLTLERSRMPWHDSFAGVLENGLLEGSLSKTLAACGQSASSGKEWANVLLSLGTGEAALMGRTPGEPMLRLRRLTRNAAGGVVEFVETLLDPRHFGMRMEF
ncbi:GntR family transcriptional regulator [Pararhodobacter sp.]|uniref:GntR family transcriptional regulator n=1 Tax=Pararhodobacter sp. TaxID=2127056 RepID=UPI002FDD73B5